MFRKRKLRLRRCRRRPQAPVHRFRALGRCGYEISARQRSAFMRGPARLTLDRQGPAGSPSFDPNQADPRTTICDMASGRLTISVGAHSVATQDRRVFRGRPDSPHRQSTRAFETGCRGGAGRGRAERTRVLSTASVELPAHPPADKRRSAACGRDGGASILPRIRPIRRRPAHGRTNPHGDSCDGQQRRPRSGPTQKRPLSVVKQAASCGMTSLDRSQPCRSVAVPLSVMPIHCSALRGFAYLPAAPGSTHLLRYRARNPGTAPLRIPWGNAGQRRSGSPRCARTASEATAALGSRRKIQQPRQRRAAPRTALRARPGMSRGPVWRHRLDQRRSIRRPEDAKSVM